MKNLDWESFAFFAALVLMPALIVGVSSYYLFPDMRWMSTGLLLIAVIVAGLVHRRTSEPVPWLRQLGIILAAVMCFTMGSNLISHVGYTRDLSAASASRIQRQEDETRELSALETKAKIQRDLTEAETKRIGELRRMLVQTPIKQRETLLSKLAGNVPLPLSTPPTTQRQAQLATMTPDQVRDEWQPWLLKLLILDVIVSLVCGTVAGYARNWDGDGNGIPEWIEQVARNRTEEQFAQHWPNEYATYGQVLKFASPKD